MWNSVVITFQLQFYYWQNCSSNTWECKNTENPQLTYNDCCFTSVCFYFCLALGSLQSFCCWRRQFMAVLTGQVHWIRSWPLTSHPKASWFSWPLSSGCHFICTWPLSQLNFKGMDLPSCLSSHQGHDTFFHWLSNQAITPHAYNFVFNWLLPTWSGIEVEMHQSVCWIKQVLITFELYIFLKKLF